MLILDGWGISTISEGNAMAAARTPNMHALLQGHPSMALQAAGTAVGLAWGEAGNSEVGHLNLGAGRIVFPESPDISTAIADGSFFQNQVFIDAVQHVKKNNSALHFIGMLNPEEGSAGLTHAAALIELAAKQQFDRVYLHLLLAKGGSLQDSMLNYITELQAILKQSGVGQIATISGQYYAMDKEKRWEHTARAYRLMVDGEGSQVDTVEEILQRNHAQNLTEEYLEPTRLGNPPKIQDNDAIIFFNWRSERSRQLAKAFVAPYYGEFEHGKPLKNLYLVTMSSFQQDMTVKAAFLVKNIEDGLAETLSKKGLRQYHVAETEKFSHVTTFFNGGSETPFEGEQDEEVPSPSVRGYDELPQMASPAVADKLIGAIQAGAADFYVANFANMDMVGHTGSFQAATAAAEAVDQELGRVMEAAKGAGANLIVTSDHGNAEQMTNVQSGITNVDHSNNPVPFILLSPDEHRLTGQDRSIMDGSLPSGMLADVAPTVLDLLGVNKPAEMTGYTLIARDDADSLV